MTDRTLPPASVLSPNFPITRREVCRGATGGGTDRVGRNPWQMSSLRGLAVTARKTWVSIFRVERRDIGLLPASA